MSVVKAIVQLGKDLGMTVVAEGVEKKAQLDALGALPDIENLLCVLDTEGFDDAAFGQGLLKSGLQDHRGQVPHELAPSEATRFRQNIVHVALMRNMSSHNMALT